MTKALVRRPGTALVRRPGARGWPGRGGGAHAYLSPAPEWRGTTVQVCGLWPYGAGSGTPRRGVPVGRDLTSGATICCDPISWFQRAKLISNPSAFVLGQPGLGKSSLVRRWVLGLAGYGVTPMIVGDLKPDYVDLTRALGGQVIELGRGRGYLNVLDPGEAGRAASRLTGNARRAVLADSQARRLTMVCALVTILRRSPPTDREESILAECLAVLDDRHEGRPAPVLRDLLQVLRDAPPTVRQVALDRGDRTRYDAITEGLESSLAGLLGRGRLGEVFAQPTSEPMQLDRPVCFDISSIDDSEGALQAAALMACWSYGFGAVSAAQALTDAGLAPQRRFFLVLDELWRVLRASSGLVERVDTLTRLNRQRGVGQAMVTHSMRDLLALPDEADRLKAAGFAERAGLIAAAGLPEDEMPRLGRVVALTTVEQQRLTEWSTPPGWDPQDDDTPPPGRGNFLLKVGGRPGITMHVDLTPAELDLYDTNRKWH
ncbi:ATP/GTP-binding protein [Streptomyces albidoflavus]|uniref:ATP/GTP-binding protein n=1 Tax=Streptomyces albidoflavus TaxID=1886 RepID=UPI0033FC2B43